MQSQKVTGNKSFIYLFIYLFRADTTKTLQPVIQIYLSYKAAVDNVLL